MEQCIDKKILLQLHHGDMKAFEFVYHHYVGRIYNFILSIVKDEVTIIRFNPRPFFADMG